MQAAAYARYSTEHQTDSSIAYQMRKIEEYCDAHGITVSARYADEVDADALSIELDQIRHLQDHGEISLPVANELRQRVYVLQMSLGE